MRRGNKGIKLKQRLSSLDTKAGKVGVGITVGNDRPAQTANGEFVKAGKFRVLWYERKPDKDKAGQNNKKLTKYLRRKTIKVDSNRDLAEQIIEGISRFAGHIHNG